MPTVLGRAEIEAILPHREPFLLIDEVVELDPGERVVARKTVRPDEWYLAGHFPGRMIYPGVLLVECVAQLAAVVYGSAALARAGEDATDVAERVGYLAEIRQAKFLRPVYPGDQVVIRAQSGSRLGALIAVNGQASVGPDVVMTARLTVTEREQEDQP